MSVPASQVMTRLERELRDLWNVAPAPGDVPRSRACTMNLVAVGATRAVCEAYVATIDEVTRSVPARAIVVALDPDAREDALEGDVSAVCDTAGGQSVCSERVRLFAKGTVVARVGSVVDALCVSELPTVLVWLGRVHVDDPVFASLADDAQRIILDSEQASLAGLLAVVRWVERGADRAKVADLAWTRLAVWQEMAARFFDEPRLSALASRMTSLSLTQASEPGSRLGAEGMLFLGWIATRLGWTAARLGGALRLKRVDGASVALVPRAVARAGIPPGSLAAVALEAESAGLSLKGTLDMLDDPDGASDKAALRWRLQAGEAALEQRVRLRADRGAELLERTLHRPASDAALLQAAAFAGGLAEDGIVCG